MSDDVLQRLDAAETALRMITEQHIALTNQFAELTRRLKYYEAHVPSIHEARAKIDSARSHGMISVHRA